MCDSGMYDVRFDVVVVILVVFVLFFFGFKGIVPVPLNDIQYLFYKNPFFVFVRFWCLVSLAQRPYRRCAPPTSSPPPGGT